MRSGPLLALACAAGLSGVLMASAGTAAPSASARAFSAPLLVDRSAAQSTGEPSIEVAPDGTLYIAAPNGPGVRAPSALGGFGLGGNLLWRSVDKGATWRFLGSFDVPIGGGDADVVTDSKGVIYASGLSYVACSTVATSTDRGETFTQVPVAGCGRIPLSNDRQWNALDGDTTLYTSIGNTEDRSIDLVRSQVVNRLTIPSVTMTLSDRPDYQWPGTVVVDRRNGTTYTVWNTTGSPNNCDDTRCNGPASSARPDDILISVLPRGSTSPPPPVLVASRPFDTFDSFVVNAVDESGRIYVVWNERRPAQQETWVMLSSSRDGRTWSTPVKVSSVPRTATFPWVTAGSDGQLAVTYYGAAARASSPQRVDQETPWQVFSAFSTDAGRTFTEYRTTGDMNYGQICTSGTGCRSGGRNLLDFFETAIDADGCLLTTFTDNSSRTPYVAFVRQNQGPGLLTGKSCGGVTAAAPGKPSPGKAGPRSPTEGPGDPIAATGPSAALALAGVALLAVAAVFGRRARSGIREGR